MEEASARSGDSSAQMELQTPDLSPEFTRGPFGDNAQLFELLLPKKNKWDLNGEKEDYEMREIKEEMKVKVK